MAVVAGVALLVVLFSVARWYHRSQPAYVLETFEHINSAADVQGYSESFTPQGRAIILWLMKKQGDKPASSERPVYSAPIISGHTCDVPVRQGNMTGTIRLVRTDHWRFNDIYFDKAGSRKVELWASYLKDHPVGAWWNQHGDEAVGAFFKGVLIGVSAAL